MTFINKNLYQHKSLTNALLRLNDTIIKHDNLPDSRFLSEFGKIMDGVSSSNRKFDEKIINELKTTGNNFEVADELYHPSTDIFDGESYEYGITKVDKNDQFYYGNQEYVDGNVQCTAVYRLRFGDRLCAEIKNYHTLKIVDYTETSRPYPILDIEDLTSAGRYNSISLYNNTFVERLTSAGRIYSTSFTHTRYLSAGWDDAITSQGQFFGVKTLFTLKEFKAPIESLTGGGKFYNMSYPNNGIKYNDGPDKLTGGGIIINMEYDWKDE